MHRLLLLASLIATTLPAAAEPINARLYKSTYGYMPGCHACHGDGGGSPLNAYGRAFDAAGAGAGAFAAIAETDSDGDGFANGAEAKAKANPGDGDSIPGDAGDWLALNNLIPAEVQQAFPDVRLYKPIDALLTQAEIERAAAWGVTLAARDENTIYVPVQDRRPIGTALIVAGGEGEERFYLLLLTDRALALTGVQPVSGPLPPAGDAAYARYVGATPEAFPATEDAAAAALAAAIQRGLALIHVRLKSS